MDVLRDRDDAGARLTWLLSPLVVQGDATGAVVLGLPRGGVPIGAAIARGLGLPLDVVVVRKLGAPANPEYGFGAVGEAGITVLDEQAMAILQISDDEVARIEARERDELERRLATYRAVRPSVPLAGRTAIVVDDGIATGVSARAAARVARAGGAARVIVAAGVAAPESLHALMDDGSADLALAALIPDRLLAVGQFYLNFSQTPEREVLRILGEAAAE
ncbi:phosphoribosyltransferase family protein [Demequina sp. SYSU T00192]|uniref:Phosphoribosyltransferase family protein n=1 Tax=Demequina litoralis TaxID=3051660 RepID=A0ABT8G647_9MICO|nr:phosphoribosyltransferase family protein [Demequina sp. SYSU T00192]MDN4474616.1 phosphoribosyltransferase family protein [Demequina sp. SYSU T00192]